MGADEDLEVLNGRGREFDARHWLQVVERDRLAALGLSETILRALVGARDAVQQLDDIRSIRVGLI